MSLTDKTLIKRSDGIVTRNVAGETLLVPITQIGADLQKVYLLNETATVVWQLLTEPRRIDSLVDHLRTQYKGEQQVIRQDAIDILSDLLNRKFICEIAAED